ncbi:unnamed protein product [Brassica rapa]|uniref:Uncharacterized protein n=1 Tax=Brassica campestris TaxID=3711 RepID=A0A3P6BAP0_BRACM|nr:unnamed protein product [Brassica rapa]VDD02233.1 unnamed protein product [Brassica rapa]
MSKSKMEIKVRLEEKNKEEDLASKQVSDELEKSCLTEEDDDDYLSDQNSKKRTRVLKTTSESEQRKKRKSSKEPRYNNTSSFDDWLFVGTVNPQKKAIKIDDEDMNLKLERSSSSACGGCFFPKAQFLSQVGIYSLPYTVLF